jgi:hypothetical protein
MTTMFRQKYKCAVCGTEKEFYGIASTNSFGSPDLDLRPPEMQRSTMGQWIQQCPKCGYVSGSIDDAAGKVTIKWLKSKEYIHNDGIEFQSGLADQFYKYYKISLLNEDNETAFYSLLHASWACDDCDDTKNAAHCRIMAIPLLTKLIDGIVAGKPEPEEDCDEDADEKKDNLLLMKTDLLRRSGQFDKLLSEYASRSFKNDIMNKVLAFQLAKAAEKDTACYTIQEAVEWNK